MVKKELIKTIKEKETQLAKLQQHVEKSAVCAELYNKVVLEKAILKKELDDMSKNKGLLAKLKSLIPHEKVYICDYFKE